MLNDALQESIRSLETEQKNIQKALDALYPLVGRQGGLSQQPVRTVVKRASGFRVGSAASIIRQYVRDNPGLTTTQITKGLAGRVTNKSVNSAMGAGMKSGWITANKNNIPYTYSCADNPAPMTTTQQRIPRSETFSRIRNYLEDNGGKTLLQISQFLSLSKNQVGNTLYGPRHKNNFVCDRTTNPITWSLAPTNNTEPVPAEVREDLPSEEGLATAFAERYPGMNSDS